MSCPSHARQREGGAENETLRSRFFNEDKLKLSEELERYKLILKQLDLARQRLFDLGFITEGDEFKIEKFVVAEKVRVDKMLKAFGIAHSHVPTGIPVVDAANRVSPKTNGA
jgi:hypothetical protein